MLIEEVLREFKRTHLEHIEDIILTAGHPGGQAVIGYFTDIYNMLKGGGSSALQVSVKWDGAPAVVCGINPDNGRFFVGTKSVFAQSAKINYTKQDIARNHGTGDLGEKLLKCLVHLPKLNIQGVVQGDMMFTDNDLNTQDINGGKFITFQPNEIVYAVPEDSDIGKKIASAKVGIIFHTTYVGERLADMNAEAGVDVSKFSTSPDVWFDNATYKNVSGSATFTKGESDKFAEGINMLKSLLTKVPQNLSAMLSANKDFIPMFQMFINSEIKQGRIPTDANEFLKGFQEFYLARMQQQASGLKAPKAIALRQQKMSEMPQFLNTVRKPLQAMLAFYKQTQALKAEALQKMNQAMQVGTFAQTDAGLEVTDPEGFVAVGTDGGAVKLVDRLTFSRRNLTAIKKFEKTQ
jgi:hypothetical protein